MTMQYIRENLDKIQLSDHFTAEELCFSRTALKNGIDNTPNLPQLMALKVTTELILEPTRVQFERPIPKEFGITSGLRVLELNRAIGSKDSSDHINGNAVDFKVPTISNYRVAKWMQDNLRFDQLILEKHGNGEVLNRGWIHCSFRTLEKNRQQVLTYDGKVYHKGIRLYD